MIIDLPILMPAVCVLHWAPVMWQLFLEKGLIKQLGACSLPLTFLHCYTKAAWETIIVGNLQCTNVLISLTFLYWANPSCNLSVSLEKHAPSLKSSHIKAEYITRHFLGLEIRWIAWLNYEMQQDTKICLLLETKQHIVLLCLCECNAISQFHFSRPCWKWS